MKESELLAIMAESLKTKYGFLGAYSEYDGLDVQNLKGFSDFNK